MNGKRKKLIISTFIVMIIALSSVVVYYWYNNTYYVSTEDSKVAGDIMQVGPQISGRLLELNVKEGDTVVKDQIIGRQEMSTLPDINVDQSVIRAPISGIVIKKQDLVGAIVSPGQTLLMMIDPSKLYINANIEETDLSKIKKGQKVDITIDQYKGVKLSGKVESIGKAANSAFSLLPTSTSSTFTKVVQKIPVKIAFDKSYDGILVGTNAVIKIHIK